jgi:molybdopterin synthase sulfur carrier subunit
MVTDDDAALATATITVNVRYFARLRESLGTGAERIELAAPSANAGALRDLLCARGGAWADELALGRALRVAVNQEMAGPETALHDGDEIGFLPPVTGG